MRRHGEHDLGFFVWAVPGFLLTFGVIGALTIGPPFFLLGAALLFYLWARGPGWPADLGLIAGVGAGALLLASFQATGGDSPTPWIEIGVGLVAASAGAFWWLRCRPTRT